MDLVANPFQGDKREPDIYGVEILQQFSTLNNHTHSAPEPKTNTVSMMKSDFQIAFPRNLLGVSPMYLCYTVRETLLRVINTITTDKVILRGHEERVQDMKFSPIASTGLLCSVDDNSTDDSSKHHIFIWKLTQSQSLLNYVTVKSFFLSACFVLPHPISPDTWLIASNNPQGSLGLLTTADDSDEVKSYSHLKLHKTYSSHYSISDIAISPDGKFIAVIVYRGESSKRESQLSLLFVNQNAPSSELIECYTLAITDAVCLCFTRVGLAVASRIEADSAVAEPNADRCILLEVYNVDSDSTGSQVKLSVTQTVEVHFPVFKSCSEDPRLQCHPVTEFSLTIEQHRGKFLMLSHRQSAHVSCFALNPKVSFYGASQSQPTGAGLPLCHMTLVDLKHPIESIDCTLISGRDHYSDEEIEHLELACLQPLPNQQCTVQQFHLPTRSLINNHAYDLSIHHPGPSINSTSTMLSPSSLGHNHKSDCQSTPGSASDRLNNVSGPKPIGMGNIESGSLLQMLRASKNKEPNDNLMPWETAGIGPTVVPVTSLSETYPSSVDTNSRQNQSQSRSILGLLKGSLIGGQVSKPSSINQSEATSTSTVDFPSVEVEVSDKNDDEMIEVDEEDFEEENNPGDEGEDDENYNDEDRERETDEIVGSQIKPVDSVSDWAAASTGLSQAVDTNRIADTFRNQSQHSSIDNALLQQLISEVASLREFVETQTTKNGVKHEENKAVDAKISQADSLEIAQLVFQAVTRSMETTSKQLLVSVQSQMKSSIDTNNTNATVLVNTINLAVKRAVEAETKKVFETTLKSRSWIDENLKGVVDTLRQEVSSALAQKLPDAVAGAVKETVKLTLSSSFRQAFESVLLPAFQAGTEHMFAQLRESFERSMAQLQGDARDLLANSTASTTSLQAEVTSLRSAVVGLESKIDALTAAANRGSLGGGSYQAPSLPDPIALLREGKVSEALESALEQKDVRQLVELLGAMPGPSMLSQHCDSLLQLCAVQQLAADFASTVPLEGTSQRLEWVKSLVMALLFSGDSYLDSPKIKPVLTSILASLRGAEARISKNLASGDTTENATVANVTDLKMVIAVMSSK